MAEHDLHTVAFPTLDDLQVDTLAKFGTRRALHDGELLFKAGTRDYKFFVVLRGAVEIVEDSSGEPKTVTVHHVHEFGGDVDLLTGRPALISAVARGEHRGLRDRAGRYQAHHGRTARARRAAPPCVYYAARAARGVGFSRDPRARGRLLARHIPHPGLSRQKPSPVHVDRCRP